MDSTTLSPASTPDTRLVEFLHGIRDELPILLGVIPFGMIYGVMALQAGLPAGVAQAMSSMLFAGSAQFLSLQLFAGGAPAAVIVLTAFVINLRHMLYSLSFAPHLQRLPARWKALLAYLLTDEAFAVSILRFRRDDASPHRHWHLFGSGLALWSAWQISTALGIFLGAQVPGAWSLDFAMALTFLALLIPVVKDKPTAAAALSAGVASILFAGLPYKLGLIAAAFIGIAVGVWGEKR